jgi:hypothetical protein
VSSNSFSNAIFLGILAAVGVVLYTGFAYLVTHSKNIEVKRRWRYSILCGVSFGVFTSIMFGVVSVLALFGDESELGYMTAFKSPRNPLDLLMGIFSFIVYPVLISLPFAFLVTFGTYWKQLNMGDMLINHLIYPIKKHPSDQSPDTIFDRVRAHIAKFIG